MGSQNAGTCHKHLAEEQSPGIFQNGSAVFQAHHVGWIICGAFTAVATVTSLWLIDKHLQWYTNKREQRYIVRLLFLVPLYALISFASFLFWNNATPLILVRDAYEAIVLTAFFYLLLVYLSPDPEEQRRIFLKRGLSKGNDTAARLKGEKLKKWMWPLGFIKKKPKDGLYFLQLMKWGVLQYCVIRPVTALAAVILDYAGYYCEASWSPVWGHLWIVIIISISVTIAMYCLLQLYMPVAKELKPHGVILKLFSVKAVVFLTFWQATLLAALSMVGVVKGTRYMTAEDINIGIGAILQCFEMMIFAFVHIKAFTYKPYRPFHDPSSKDAPPSKTPRFLSLGHALDFRETFREIWIGCVYMYDKMRGREPRHDFRARRVAHYEGAFGQSRPQQTVKQNGASPVVENVKGRKGGNAKQTQLSPSTDILVNQEVEVDVSGERQWLGLGDDYGYGLGYFRRERSEGLSVQIDKELQKRGYHPDGLSGQGVQSTTGPQPPLGVEGPPPAKRRERSWWQNVYHHISSSSTRHQKENTDNSFTPSLPRRLQSKASRSRRGSEAQHTLLQPDPNEPHDLEDPPPRSTLHTDPLAQEPLLPPTFHRVSPSSSGASMNSDVLAPLNSYQERRRSNYRPKRHRRNTNSQGSASALLPPAPHALGPIAPSPPESTIDMAELDPRLSWPQHDPNSLLSIPTPPSGYYARSDSLLNRIFPPSEVGSMEGRSRIDTDSAYSLPSIVSGEEGSAAVKPTGDARLHVHEHTYHPTASVSALHTPWTADVLHSESLAYDRDQYSLSNKPSVGEFGEPPPLPEKDANYLPAFRRPHPAGVGSRRPTSHRTKTRDSGASLPSLPEHSQFAMAPIVPPFLIMKNDTARSSTLVDSPPASPQSAYFSESHHRMSGYGGESSSRATPLSGGTPLLPGRYPEINVERGGDPTSGHALQTKRPARKQLRPAPPQSSDGYHHPQSKRSSIAVSTRPPSSDTSSSSAVGAFGSLPPPVYPPRPQQYADYLDVPTTRSGHRRERARRSRFPEDSEDDDHDDQVSDTVSVNTFYTAASQPIPTRATATTPATPTFGSGTRRT